MKIEIKSVEKLSEEDINLMNKQRIKEYGSRGEANFQAEDKGAIFFFVKEDEKTMAFGMLKPIKIEYLHEEYNILGIGRGMAMKKGKGYGRMLSAARIDYLKKTGKTGLAFTSRKNLGFFEKTGFKTSKNLIKRFKYKDPKTGEIISDLDGDGVYYEGRDEFISKILSTKGIAYTNVTFW